MASPLAGQQWNDSTSVALATRAIERRTIAVADSSLAGYSAKARGLITFRADVDLDEASSSRLLKADRVEVEVYWQRPDQSKQIIRAWQDTTLFPTGIWYHRDHLGIVTDDFGNAIRLGDGDEVRDVVHPFAPTGLVHYEYRLADTITVTLGSSRLVLVGLEVRPKDHRAPAVIGRLYLDRDRLQVVRSEFGFTPASYLDRELEDITVRLERALFEGRYWLPYRQVIEIRRRTTAVRLPIRTVIRGDWQIGDHEINPALPPIEWRGPSVAGMRRPVRAGPPLAFGPLVDSSLAATGRLDALRQEARAIARGRLLDGLPRFGLSVSRMSDVARFNRVEGLAVGGGISLRGAIGDELRIGVGYGFGDRRLSGRVKATGRLAGSTVTLRAERAVFDVGQSPAASPLVNSFLGQELGRDLGDYVRRDLLGLGIRTRLGPVATGSAELGWVRSEAAAVVARAAHGAFRPNSVPGDRGRLFGQVGLTFDGSRSVGEQRRGEFTFEAGTGSGGFARALATGDFSVGLTGGTLSARGVLGAAIGRLPPWRSMVIGGQGTLLGLPHRAYGGRRIALGSAEWLAVVPAPSLPLGPFGRTGWSLRIGPAVSAGWAAGAVEGAPWVPSAGVRVAVGGVVELFDRTVRLELGRGLGEGGHWGLAVDLPRLWWPLL
ncbi:MAG: hypothetical protein FJ206_09765 [Gemmatimonadetes bacterium]|nr:hypothetical protein [Gemmatimonadota bacterium]